MSNLALIVAVIVGALALLGVGFGAGHVLTRRKREEERAAGLHASVELRGEREELNEEIRADSAVIDADERARLVAERIREALDME